MDEIINKRIGEIDKSIIINRLIQIKSLEILFSINYHYLKWKLSQQQHLSRMQLVIQMEIG